MQVILSVRVRGPRLVRAWFGVALSLTLASGPALAATDDQIPDSLVASGNAAAALSEAFKTFPGGAAPQRAPLVPSDYTIQILERENEELVAFYPNIRSFPFVVHVRGGVVASHEAIRPAMDATHRYSGGDCRRNDRRIFVRTRQQ